MSYKAKVFAVGTELEFEETSLKEMWKRLAFFQSLPDTCPIDDTPTRLFYKEPEGNSYFSVVNTGQLHLEYKLGQYKEAKDDLFGKGEWWWWDYTNKVDVLLCKWGELTEEGEAMRERLKGSAPVAHKGPQAPQSEQAANRTAQHRNTPQSPSVSVEELEDAIRDAPPLDDSWDGLVEEADRNRAADKKANTPFVWPVGGAHLEKCSGTINNPDLSDNAYKLNKAIWDADRAGSGKMSNEIKAGKKSSQYGTLVWQLDQRYGKDGHSAILTALCGRLISHDSLPGFEVKKVIDWLFNKDNAFDAQLGVLDAYVDSLKADIAQFEVA